MKMDPMCKKCQKKCKQRHPAVVVVSCAKFIPTASIKVMKEPSMEVVPG